MVSAIRSKDLHKTAGCASLKQISPTGRFWLGQKTLRGASNQELDGYITYLLTTRENINLAKMSNYCSHRLGGLSVADRIRHESVNALTAAKLQRIAFKDAPSLEP